MPQHEIKIYLLPFHFFPTFDVPAVTVRFLCLRLQQRRIERAMDLTDSFTWEDLPTRDADTGQLAPAGWIPLTLTYGRNAAIVILCVHTVQSTIRIVTNHETQFNAWYPFDWTVSPFYELVNISQVTVSKTEFSCICTKSIISLTVLVSWRISLFSLSIIRSILFRIFLRCCSTKDRWSIGWRRGIWIKFNNTLLLYPLKGAKTYL
jgi:hypothetical protein